jgi:hypothetical protein
MKRLKVCVGILLIFILGILAGTLGTGFFIKHRVEKFIRGDGPPPPIRVLERLSAKLDLSKPQQIEIEKILKQTHDQWVKFRQEYRPEFEQIFNDTIEQMKEKLDSRQKQKLEKLNERFMRRFRNHAGRHPFISEKTPEQVFSDMKIRLNLTREQKAEVRPIIESSIENQRKILKKYKDQQEQVFRSLRTEMRKLQKSVEKRLGNILTAEQMEDYRGFNYEECFMMRRFRIGTFH